MQTQRTFIDDLKHRYKHGGMHIRLIFINAIVFATIGITFIFGGLAEQEEATEYMLLQIFGLQTEPIEFITHPWALFTSIFAHFGIIHLLMNMIFLYFAGKHFEQIFGAKRLLATYILGGIAGGLLEFFVRTLFPSLSNIFVIGASGSIMAIFIAIAFYQPNLKVRLFMLPPFRIIWIAVVFILFDVIKFNSNDDVAHFAHIGGALIGALSVQNIHSSSNLITASQRMMEFIRQMFSRNKRPKLKVVRGDQVRKMTDEEYNKNAKERQKETDRILDKISKSGYDSLNKREKDFLFNQSK
ncbi:MAG: membrane associated rhomboid family serine protease [Crocinitomicaceae bacterium]|jgi:membrane associated rhomboid family serine protease